MTTNHSVLEVWHQIFADWEVQIMWNLQAKICTEKHVLVKKKILEAMVSKKRSYWQSSGTWKDPSQRICLKIVTLQTVFPIANPSSKKIHLIYWMALIYLVSSYYFCLREFCWHRVIWFHAANYRPQKTITVSTLLNTNNLQLHDTKYSYYSYYHMYQILRLQLHKTKYSYYSYMVPSIPFEHGKLLNKSIWFLYVTLTGTITWYIMTIYILRHFDSVK